MAIGGGVVRLLWNSLLPTLFGLPSITFWQALGLLALSRILFGGFGLGGGSRHSYSRRRMAERWEQMTPEEREKFRQRFYGRGGDTPPLDSMPSA
ncbi:MAG TPA: HMG-box domain-containing protein [Thermoanaerobaculia bacterium]|nr:HMG-box domain-containing protein [Thermoanaerobaculia bacterium]